MKLRQIILAGVVGASLLLTPMLSIAKPGNSFTDKQQGDIQVIVKEYLVQNPEILLEVSKKDLKV